MVSLLIWEKSEKSEVKRKPIEGEEKKQKED